MKLFAVVALVLAAALIPVVAGEFWTIRYGLLIEWHTYYHRISDDAIDEGSPR